MRSDRTAYTTRTTEAFRDAAICLSLQVSEDLISDALHIFPNSGLPDPADSPPQSPQGSRNLEVAPHVRCDLPSPILRVRSPRQHRLATGPIFPMPKVAIAEDHRAMPCQNEI